MPSDRLDLVLLNGAPSLLRHRVITTGRLLFERHPRTRVRFVTRAIQDYQDMQVRREFSYRKRVQRLKEGALHGGSGDLLAEARRVARLPTDLAGRLRSWAGFRNVLVHEYLDIDHGIAWRAIQKELADLEAFSRWAASQLE